MDLLAAESMGEVLVSGDWVPCHLVYRLAAVHHRFLRSTLYRFAGRQSDAFAAGATEQS